MVLLQVIVLLLSGGVGLGGNDGLFAAGRQYGALREDARLVIKT